MIQVVQSQELHEATQTLIDNLIASDPFVRYHEAQARLKADDEANRLIEKLTRVQATVRESQKTGNISDKEIAALREAQDNAQSNPVIVEYAMAQQDAIQTLKKVNHQIGELLGIDFASFAKHSSCC